MGAQRLPYCLQRSIRDAQGAGKRGVSRDMRVKQPGSIRRLPIPIGHDQRLYRIARVTAASRDGLIGRRFKPGGGCLSGSAGITVSH
jgi:hypothetical protein